MTEERDYLIHPHFILMILLLAGISSLFLGFSAAYLYNRFQQSIPPVELPSLFYFNTLLLLSSSLTLWRAKNAYRNDQTERYKWMLGITLILTVLFLVSQIFAWLQMQSQDIFINYSNMASYLYAISALHFIHVIVGIPFLVLFLTTAIRKMKTPVSVLIYFSDLDKRRKLNLLNIYWHFLDGLWIYLVLFFMINYLIG